MSRLRQASAAPLRLGEPKRIGRGPLRGRSAVICVETAVATPAGGACVVGWVADPSGKGGVRLDTAAGELDLPAGDFSAFVAGRRKAKRSSSRSRPGSERRSASRHRSAPGSAPTLEAARRVGIRALAPHLPESSAELTEAWRDALLGLSWLLPEGSEEGAALEAYLLLGEPLKLPPEAPPSASRPDAPDPRAREAAKALRETGLFDEEWYRERYPDVISSGADPLLHYCEFGWIEDRDPSSSFSTSSYLAANPDVVASGMNPLWHYAAFGREEGRAMAPADPAKPPRRQQYER